MRGNEREGYKFLSLEYVITLVYDNRFTTVLQIKQGGRSLEGTTLRCKNC